MHDKMDIAVKHHLSSTDKFIICGHIEGTYETESGKVVCSYDLELDTKMSSPTINIENVLKDNLASFLYATSNRILRTKQ